MRISQKWHNAENCISRTPVKMVNGSIQDYKNACIESAKKKDLVFKPSENNSTPYFLLS